MASAKLKVYCTQYCPKCNQLLDYLNKKKADYISYDVDKDEKARKEAARFAGTDDIGSSDKLPIVVAGGKVLFGFDKKEIDGCLS